MATITITSTDTSQTSIIWSAWQAAASTTAVSSSDRIWGTWTATVPTTGTGSTTLTVNVDGIWRAWYVTETSNQPSYPPWPSLPRRSEAEVAEQRRRDEEARAKMLAWEEQRRQERREAEARAEAFLLTHLDDAQRATYEAARYFDVLSDDGARTYRLYKGVSGNVKLLEVETGRAQRSYCAHPREDLPVADVVLAQKLMLEYAEDEFLRIAHMRRLDD